MPLFALSEITYLASIPLSFTENRCRWNEGAQASDGQGI